ncbi:probable protein phosphatase 2C 4 [Aristolochia californica]|uniref:probable protein phosphatase 2C 4 n=1 Tax=Aristolochia californica TaxID=171875 RepID=UPI0035DCBD6D
MGNGIGKLCFCFNGDFSHRRRRHDIALVMSDPLDEGLGHSFCYVRPDPAKISSSKVHSEETTTTFRTISGASVSANTSTPLSTALSDLYSYGCFDRASAAFESSTSFASIPLQPVPRMNSGPIGPAYTGIPMSGPIERGFLSGPIERGFMSGPLDRSLMSGPLDRGLFSGPIMSDNDQFQRSFSHGGYHFRHKSRKESLIRVLRQAISKARVRGGHSSIVAPVKGPVFVKDLDWVGGPERIGAENLTISSTTNLSSDLSLEDDDSSESQSLQWAQGKAGEDRVHVVVSEEHGWVFVGIYDGFNGPDAPDYLLSNLYPAVHKELKGLLWDDKFETLADSNSVEVPVRTSEADQSTADKSVIINTSRSVETESYPLESNSCSTSNSEPKRSKGKRSKNRFKNAGKRWEENQRRWKGEWERERLELERKLKEQLSRSTSNQGVNHSDVLNALSQALRKTEEAYLDTADKMVTENPELALMGSCVLAMLMKGEDVYLMNVGDSRAVLARKAEPDVWGSLGKDHQDLERIKEETLHDLESDVEVYESLPSLCALQLSMDHSTSVEEEVERIRNEHPDDSSALLNDRVKGTLKVTRAFGAGFLKQEGSSLASPEIEKFYFRSLFTGAAF